MKKYILLNEKFGRTINERINIINKYDLYNINKIKDVKYIYDNIIRKEHIMAGDSLLWFGNNIKKNDEFNFIFIDLIFLYLDNNGTKIYYRDIKNEEFKYLENCEIFIYRTRSKEIMKNLYNMQSKINIFNIKIKGNIKFMNLDISGSVKKDLLMFSYYPYINTGGVYPFSSNHLYFDKFIDFLKYKNIGPFVLKINKTCLGAGIMFFKDGLNKKQEKNRFIEQLKLKGEKEFVISKYIDSNDEVRIYFTNKNKFKEIFSIVKHKQKGKDTHHSGGVINYELIDAKKYLGKYYKDIISFIEENEIRFGAMDILIGKDGHPYIIENNSFADILAGKDHNKLVDKWIKALETFWE